MTVIDLCQIYSDYWLQSATPPSLAFEVEEQRKVVERMLQLDRAGSAAYQRTHFTPGHFTGSALVCDMKFERVALTLHRKLGIWLQFGGHADGQTDLAQVSRREAEEESGLTQLHLCDPRGRATGTLALDLDIHDIPARANEPPHQHFDACFLFLTSQTELICSHESHRVEWFSLDQAESQDIDQALRRRLAKLRNLVQQNFMVAL